METKFIPNVKKTPSGYYKINCKIYPYGMSYVPKKNNEIYPLGKIVMGEIINDVEIRLLSNKQHDLTWKISPTKVGWFEKYELVDEVTFYQPV